MLEVKFVEKYDEEAGCICILVSEKLDLSAYAELLDKKYNGIINQTLKSFDNFSGKFGQVRSITVINANKKLQLIYLIGVGNEKSLTEVKIEELGSHISCALKSSRCAKGFIEAPRLGKCDATKVSALLASGVTLSNYSFEKYHTTKKSEELPKLKKVEFFSDNAKKAKEEFVYYSAIAQAIYEARNISNEPANIKFPESYSGIIKSTLEPLGIEIEILGEKEMKKLGMNALIGVGQGSSKESKLVIMKYFGKNDDSKPVALVGKGVTFDTGGISIKPSANMGDMKYDMCGSAAVFGTMMALAVRKAKTNVIGVVGLVENMPGGNAQRPGDVVISMSGKTIEILDTDAEGRLVLADALWYTQEKFKPSIMIDLATLTGAIVIALGDVYGGLFSNNDDLARKLTKAGAESGEELWRMPLHSEYDKMIKSSIADVANLGAPRAHASSNTAAQFLQHFVNEVDWAHLDIAGVAYSSKDRPLTPKGAAGYGIRLLNRLIKDNYEH